MKTRLKDFSQHLYHDVEDEEKAEEYVDSILPYVGLVVMYFNGLESSLDSVLCENFTDRTDSTGLIVLNKINFQPKVELFKRFCDDFHLCMGSEVERYDEVIFNLKESGRLRNLVVHANWEATDDEGFTYVRLKMSKSGMKQEYVQFSVESMQKIVNLIIDTTGQLSRYWEARNELLYSRC